MPSPNRAKISQVLDELSTEEAKEIYEVLNNLRSCGIEKFVNLPQIIVVGDQSSGKSSVLEALSNIHFPVQRDICTRFATEIVLHPAAETSVKASVCFDSGETPLVIHSSVCGEKDLLDIVQEAKGHMGISDNGFSRDVLHLEIGGPKMHPLTLVDLPGIFAADTDAQSAVGKQIVDTVVSRYMRNRTSIFLAVVNADRDLTSHAALAQIRAIDPNQRRTVGVITKPDLVLPGSEKEAEYIKLLKNEEGPDKIHWGWHALRNRTGTEDLEARDTVEEQFFQVGAWASISELRLGIAGLRKTLRTMVYKYLRLNLQRIISATEKNLEQRQGELTNLGPPRTTSDEMRSFLVDIASSFQSLTRDAVQGRYDNPFFGGLDSRDHKLRAQLRNFNRAFQHTLDTKGASRIIHPDNELFGKIIPPPEYLQIFFKKHPYDFPYPVAIKESDFDAKLQLQASMNQGEEFPGLPNKDLIIRLFQDQAKPWGGITRFHVEQVTVATKEFIHAVFKYLLSSRAVDHTTEAILATCVDPFFDEKERVLEEKVQELLRPYCDGYTVALDAEFYSDYNKASFDAFKPLDEPGGKDFTKASSEVRQLSGGEFGTQTVLKLLRTYYKSARSTFAVNIINLAIESCLISDIPEIVTPAKICAMSKEQLSQLAAESDEVQGRRRQLKAEVETLRTSLVVCQKYKLTTVTKLPLTRPAQTAEKTSLAIPSTPRLKAPQPDPNLTIETSTGSFRALTPSQPKSQPSDATNKLLPVSATLPKTNTSSLNNKDQASGTPLPNNNNKQLVRTGPSGVSNSVPRVDSFQPIPSGPSAVPNSAPRLNPFQPVHSAPSGVSSGVKRANPFQTVPSGPAGMPNSATTANPFRPVPTGPSALRKNSRTARSSRRIPASPSNLSGNAATVNSYHGQTSSPVTGQVPATKWESTVHYSQNEKEVFVHMCACINYSPEEVRFQYYEQQLSPGNLNL